MVREIDVSSHMTLKPFADHPECAKRRTVFTTVKAERDLIRAKGDPDQRA